MLTSASHASAKPTGPANPIEKTIAKVLGGFERTGSGALDDKRYSGSRALEFSKSWRGLKVKALTPGQALTASQKTKRKAGEDAVIADIRQSARALNLDGTALIQAIKRSQPRTVGHGHDQATQEPPRLTVGHVLDCVRWMEFAASFQDNKPQVAALVLHLATIGELPGQIDREIFGDAIETMAASPSHTAVTAWQTATRDTTAPREPHAQRARALPRDEKSQSQARQVQSAATNPSPTTDLVEGMFNTTVAVARESKREESPTTTVVHEAQAPAPQTTSSTAASRHAMTPPAPVVPQSSSSVSPDEVAPQVAKLTDELLVAKGGERLTRDVATGLAKLALGLGGIHGASDDEMLGHAKAVVLEKKMVVGTRMFKEPASVTALRQPMRDLLAAAQDRADQAKHAVRDHTPRAIKVFATS